MKNNDYDLNEETNEFDSQIKTLDEDYLPESYSNEKYISEIVGRFQSSHTEDFNYDGYDNGGYY